MRIVCGSAVLAGLIVLAAIPSEAQQRAAPQTEASQPPEETGPTEPTDPDESDAEITPDIEEILVKGARGKDLIYEQPLSITHFDASQLEELRIRDIRDLAKYTPNLEINTAFAASNPTIFIRGIGLKDYNANAPSAVAVYQDGIAINSPAGQLFQLFDVESIQVLRGPQGGADGRNATAGAIIVNSFKPDGDWSVSGDFSYGNYDKTEVTGALGFPILDQILSGRVAFTAHFADGYVNNDCAGRSLADPSAGGPTPNRDLPCFDLFFPEFPIDPDTGERLRIEDGVCDPNIRPAFGGCPFAPRVFDLKRDQNDTKNWATRGLLLFQPTLSQEWLFNFHWGQNRGDSFHLVSCGLDGFKDPLPDGSVREIGDFEARVNCIGQNTAGWERPAGSNAWTGYYDADGKEKLDILGTSLTGHWDLGSVAFLGPTRLLTISGYEENRREIDDEGDGCPCNLFSGRWTDETWQVSQELRLEGESDNYSWTGGAFFLHEELTADNEFNNATKTEFLQSFDQTLWYWAPYVGFRYDFINEDNARSGLYGLSLAGGARYNWEQKTFTLGTAIRNQAGGGFDILPPETVKDTWTGVTGEGTLIYKPVEGFTTYAKYARGMKGGHFNAGATSTEQIIDPVAPEFVHAAELGVKGQLFDDRLKFSAAVFHYWYQDMQVFDIVNEVDRPPTQQLLNSDADVHGAELEFTARPFPGLYISMSAGWLDSEFVDFQVNKRVRQLPGGPNPGGDPQEKTFDYSGNPTIAAPEWNVSGLIEYELALPRSWGTIVPQFNFSWRSEYFTDPSAAVFAFSENDPFVTYNGGVLSQSGFWLLNARLTYRWMERFEIAGWVENITNEEYLIDSFDISQCCAMVLQIYGKPRMYGLTISYNF